MRLDSQATSEFVGLLTSHQDALRSYIITQIPGSSDVPDILQEVNINPLFPFLMRGDGGILTKGEKANS